MTNSIAPCPSSAMPARVTFRAPGCSPITLSYDDMRELNVTDTVVLFGMTYKRTN